MKIKLINEFPCSPELLWEIFESPEFDQRLEQESGVRREVLSSSQNGDVEYKKLRCISLKEIPAMLKKTLGTEQFEFEQENSLDRSQGLLTWTVHTPFLPDRVNAGGTTQVQKTDTGSRRIVTGEISIRLPIVGAKIEQKLASNIEESYKIAAKIAHQMIAERS